MINNNSPVRGLVEGALSAALMGLFVLLGLYIPLLLPISSLLFPIPLILMVYRNGLKKAVMSLVVAYLLLLMLFPDPLTVTVLVIQFGLMGLLLGLLFKNHVSAGKSIAIGTLAAACLTLIILGFTLLIMGVNPLQLEEQLELIVEESIAYYEETDMLTEVDTAELRETVYGTMRMLALLAPGILIISSMLSTLLTYLLSRAVMVRMNKDIPPLPPFSRWTYPWYTVWGVIVGLGLTLIGDRYEFVLIATVGKNMLYVFGVSFLLLGLSVAAYYYKKLQISPWIKLIFVFLLAMWPFTPFLLIGVGVMDPLLDVRRINNNTDSGDKGEYKH
ncbi:YybS family protein [Desulfofalx alkaliphila]|uniref:YybS family protein n=1 Tax=Desulfofalx alkaliphila TaxID=105483 RepID=UPI000556B297|nr:YybS family protein [Desulfofalx alkaliphila]